MDKSQSDAFLLNYTFNNVVTQIYLYLGVEISFCIYVQIFQNMYFILFIPEVFFINDLLYFHDLVCGSNGMAIVFKVLVIISKVGSSFRVN
jgi:hypothetical protein